MNGADGTHHRASANGIDQHSSPAVGALGHELAFAHEERPVEVITHLLEFLDERRPAEARGAD